ncbi:MAG: glycosyltransferase [Salinibacter sp.]
MISIVDVETETSLDDYAAHASLARPVEDLRAAARQTIDRLDGRTVWMMNSTAQGGGVAEMLPKVVSMLRDLGVSTEWAVLVSDEEGFFPLTKRIHNLIHGTGTPHLSEEDETLYRSVSEACADGMARRVAPEDVVVAHDPQPLGTGALLKERLGVPAVWRCHIGLDDRNEATETAWSFLKPWATTYDQTVFSLREYVPSYLEDRSTIINPAIDPLSPKNRPLSVHALTEVLRRARLVQSGHPTIDRDFAQPALRLQRDGSFEPATRPEDLGLLHRPIVAQISRWDRLKGFGPLLQGFARMKEQAFVDRYATSARHRTRLTLTRLVLAGPDPDSVSDDPEGQEVFREICRRWQELPAEIQRDIAVLTLPMASRHNNAMMVNALQRCASIVAQNSRREGFGLTVTEGMWKRAPILGTHAAGIREQVTDGEHGRRLPESGDPKALARTIHEMLRAEEKRKEWARNARRRVSEKYLVFTQVRRWLEVLARTVDQRERAVDGSAVA